MRYRKVRISASVEPYIAGGIRDMAKELGVSRSRVIEAMLEACSWEAAREVLEEAHIDSSGINDGSH